MLHEAEEPPMEVRTGLVISFLIRIRITLIFSRSAHGASLSVLRGLCQRGRKERLGSPRTMGRQSTYPCVPTLCPPRLESRAHATAPGELVGREPCFCTGLQTENRFGISDGIYHTALLLIRSANMQTLAY